MCWYELLSELMWIVVSCLLRCLRWFELIFRGFIDSFLEVGVLILFLNLVLMFWRWELILLWCFLENWNLIICCWVVVKRCLLLWFCCLLFFSIDLVCFVFLMKLMCFLMRWILEGLLMFLMVFWSRCVLWLLFIVKK